MCEFREREGWRRRRKSKRDMQRRERGKKQQERGRRGEVMEQRDGGETNGRKVAYKKQWGKKAEMRRRAL